MNIGVGISAKAKFDPYGAARFLSSMERNAEMKSGKTSLDPRAQDFLSSHPATPERIQNAQNTARQYVSPQGGEHDREGKIRICRRVGAPQFRAHNHPFRRNASQAG